MNIKNVIQIEQFEWIGTGQTWNTAGNFTLGVRWEYCVRNILL